MAKYLVTKKIDAAELRIGMYVTALTVPWSATEFPLEGILIKSSLDIVKISRYGNHVTIDQNKSHSSKAVKKLVLSKTITNTQTNSKNIWRRLCTEKYKVEKPIARQLKSAENLLVRVHDVFEELKKDLLRVELHSVEKIKSVSYGIVSSLLENPDALLWLTKVKIQQGKIYDHIIRCAIWATLMGRSMGIKQSSLNIMIEAILLSGIGKAYLPRTVWRKHRPAEMKPEFAISINITLEKLSHCHVDHRVLTIIANMNERYDGSGYPGRNLQDRTPYLAQIAGLVETFDLLLHPMLCKKRRAFGQALSQLYCFRDSIFNAGLVEEFIFATGLYPSGTIVVLSNGCRGVVVEQTKDRRIRATVAITHDAKDYRLLRYEIAVLGEGKYQEVTIKQEANLHQINGDDMTKINQLVSKYQQGTVTNILASTKQLLSRK